MTVDEIINQCLLAIGEPDPTTPQQITREDCLAFINLLYQNKIGMALKRVSTYSYDDGSDATHTITNGVGALPQDFLAPIRVYDGDAPDQRPLKQIYDIEDKVADNAPTSQYMLPDSATIWVFGTTPAKTIKLYYYAKPAALTDSSDSTPSALKDEFHVDIFIYEIKRVVAHRLSNENDAFVQQMAIEDKIEEIARAHRMRDKAPSRVKSKRWW